MKTCWTLLLMNSSRRYLENACMYSEPSAELKTYRKDDWGLKKSPTPVKATRHAVQRTNSPLSPVEHLQTCNSWPGWRPQTRRELYWEVGHTLARTEPHLQIPSYFVEQYHFQGCKSTIFENLWTRTCHTGLHQQQFGFSLQTVDLTESVCDLLKRHDRYPQSI